MMLSINRWRMSPLFLYLLAASFLWMPFASANAESSAELVFFNDANVLIKKLMPVGIITEEHHVSDETKEGTNFYLARDGITDALVSVATIIKAAYQDGEVQVLLVMSHEARVVKAMVLAVSKAHVEAFEASVGTGVLTRFTMLSHRQLAYVTRSVREADEPTRLTAQMVSEGGTLLVYLLKQFKSSKTH